MRRRTRRLRRHRPLPVNKAPVCQIPEYTGRSLIPLPGEGPSAGVERVRAGRYAVADKNNRGLVHAVIEYSALVRFGHA